MHQYFVTGPISWFSGELNELYDHKFGVYSIATHNTCAEIVMYLMQRNKERLQCDESIFVSFKKSPKTINF